MFNYEISQAVIPQVGRSGGRAESHVKKKRGRILSAPESNDPK
jgi:hypothetical protein